MNLVQELKLFDQEVCRRITNIIDYLEKNETLSMQEVVMTELKNKIVERLNQGIAIAKENRENLETLALMAYTGASSDVQDTLFFKN